MSIEHDLDIAWNRIHKPLSGNRKGYYKGYCDGFKDARYFEATQEEQESIGAGDSARNNAGYNGSWMKRYRLIVLKRKLLSEMGASEEIIKGFDICLKTFEENQN